MAHGCAPIMESVVSVRSHRHVCVLFVASSLERSNLYLKLFKLVFGSVSLFAAENEQMLKVIKSVLF